MWDRTQVINIFYSSSGCSSSQGRESLSQLIPKHQENKWIWGVGWTGTGELCIFIKFWLFFGGVTSSSAGHGQGLKPGLLHSKLALSLPHYVYNLQIKYLYVLCALLCPKVIYFQDRNFLQYTHLCHWMVEFFYGQDLKFVKYLKTVKVTSTKTTATHAQQ